MKSEDKKRVYSRIPMRTFDLVQRISKSAGLTLSETIAMLIVLGLRVVLASGETLAEQPRDLGAVG